jgi:cytochrome c oxidase assembly protein subunit 11
LTAGSIIIIIQINNKKMKRSYYSLLNMKGIIRIQSRYASNNNHRNQSILIKKTNYMNKSYFSTKTTTTTTDKNRKVAAYSTALAIATLGLAYTAVPLYKAFCRATGYGGTAKDVTIEQAEATRPVPDARVLKITFSGQTQSSLPWKFRPLQREIRVVPGETALAFFTAKNESDKPVTGVATYNVTPMKAGVHFHKVQCFCFDEQRLRPNEEVDMPVLFYIAKEFVQDENMADVTNICLSYTFFRSKE